MKKMKVIANSASFQFYESSFQLSDIFCAWPLGRVMCRKCAFLLLCAYMHQKRHMFKCSDRITSSRLSQEHLANEMEI